MPDNFISTDASQKGFANLIYILYLIGLVTGITILVGVIMAYVAKGQAPSLLHSHYSNQISIFWKVLIFSVIGIITSFIIIGFVVLLVTLIWYISRTAKGLLALSRDEAYPNPGSWGF